MRVRFRTIAEQVAAHVREEMIRGRWGDTLPGLRPLSASLGVDPKTVQIALGQLEREGLLKSEGARRARRIVLPKLLPSSALRVGILLYDSQDKSLPLIMDLRHRLLVAGHTPFFCSKR